jgi:hypothetical protein
MLVVVFGGIILYMKEERIPNNNLIFLNKILFFRKSKEASTLV